MRRPAGVHDVCGSLRWGGEEVVMVMGRYRVGECARVCVRVVCVCDGYGYG